MNTLQVILVYPDCLLTSKDNFKPNHNKINKIFYLKKENISSELISISIF